MTDSDVLKDCARKLMEAVDYCAARRGHLDDPSELDLAMDCVSAVATNLEAEPEEERDEAAERAEFAEWQGRMRRAAI